MADTNISAEIKRYGIPIALALALAFLAAGGPEKLIGSADTETPTRWDAPALATSTSSATATGGWWDDLPTKIEVPPARPTPGGKDAGGEGVAASPTPELHMDPTLDIDLTPTFDLPGGN
jgi:hypothetical protein